MKKLLIGLLFIIVIGCASVSSSFLLKGVDGIAWGTSIKDVKKKYLDLQTIKNSEGERANFQYFAHRESDKLVRLLTFYKNRLYSVDTLLCDPPDNRKLNKCTKSYLWKPCFYNKGENRWEG